MTNFVKYENELNRINSAAHSSPEAFIADTEEAFHRNLRSIVSEIAKKNGCRMIMLFGPSSSGKTTTSHLLQNAFQKCGVGSTILSLDDFYRGEKQAPLLPNGQHDYESVEALNIPEVQACLSGLIENNFCDMPLFDFAVRRPSPDRRHVELAENGIAIVEGIHALNPVITDCLPAKRICTAYISVKQGVRSAGEELFSANDMRLVRRIVRDYYFRGTSAERTLSMWPSVMEGERKYIKPFRSEADYTINSLHLYETCVLKDKAADILACVPKESGQYAAAQKMAQTLSLFEPINSELVPKNSILREFIG